MQHFGGWIGTFFLRHNDMANLGDLLSGGNDELLLGIFKSISPRYIVFSFIYLYLLVIMLICISFVYGFATFEIHMASFYIWILIVACLLTTDNLLSFHIAVFSKIFTKASPISNN